MTTQMLSALAPLDLPILRPARFDGGGHGVLLSDLHPADQALASRIYEDVRAIADLATNQGGRPGALAEAIRRVTSDAFLAAARSLGRESARAGAPVVALQALHDARGGGLIALVANASLLARAGEDPASLAACGRYARDHCKIMRNALHDLDPGRETRDQLPRTHCAEAFARTWDGTTLMAGGRLAVVSALCDYKGGVAVCCLESGAVDRVLYNHVNNAARFVADGRIDLHVGAAGGGRLVRFTIRNAISDEEAAWLEAEAGPGLRALYRGGLTRGGQGTGLACCAEIVADAFGLTSVGEALGQGYLGARLVEREYAAWFHWPACEPPVAEQP